MVSPAYLNSRKRWARPQAIIFSNNIDLNGIEGEDFIILSDHNRSEINFSTDRIENRRRMVNAHMRSYHLADKLKISTSWEMLPSRAFNKNPEFDEDGIVSAINTIEDPLNEYTADGGAGGADLLAWYENNPGSFWVFVSYDKNSELLRDSYQNLTSYPEIIEAYFSSFDYNVVKRGGSNHDLWNVSLSLEEV